MTSNCLPQRWLSMRVADPIVIFVWVVAFGSCGCRPGVNVSLVDGDADGITLGELP